MNTWVQDAIARIAADFQRSADTHLIPLPLPTFARHGIDLYLKDESTHPTGSLKHRLARSLFLYALCNGWVREGTTIVEASSGSTAAARPSCRKSRLPSIASARPVSRSSPLWVRLLPQVVTGLLLQPMKFGLRQPLSPALSASSV